MAGPRIHDRHWIRQGFLLPAGLIDEIDKKRRVFSRGYGKFSDTTLGGNQVINPIPQACKFADIPEERMFEVGQRQGRVHSEVFDDNMVMVNLRAGVPTHTALTDFFGNFYNPQSSLLARTGRGQGIFFTIGLLGGSIITLPFKPFMMLGDLVGFVQGKSKTKFYYLKPTMPVFWNTLNGIVNAYCVERGILDGDPTFTGVGSETNVSAYSQRMPDSDKGVDDLLPAIYPRIEGSNGSGKGGIDIYALSTRYQVIANAQYNKVRAWRDSYNESFGTADAANSFNSAVIETPFTENRPDTLRKLMDRWSGSALGAATAPSEDTEKLGAAPTFYDTIVEGVGMLFGEGESKMAQAGVLDFFAAEMRDGGQFITYRVDAPGEMSESFSSSVKDSALAGSINSMSQGSRDFKFNIGGGNLSDNAFVSMIEGAIGAASNLMSGIGAAVGISGLAALAGNANIDILKYWDSSTANLPRHNYTFELKAPYQNEICRLQTLMVPMFGLLALALPRATGGSSYTSPFYVEAYCQGYAQVREGIIDSLSFTRGEFTRDGRPLSIIVNFSIVDMSSIMAMPLTANFTPLSIFDSPFSKWITNNDNAFSDYMAVLASSSLANQIYPWRKLKRNYQKMLLNMDDWFSVTHTTSWIGGWDISRAISGFWNATDRK